MINISFGHKNSTKGYKSNVMHTLGWVFGIIILLLSVLIIYIEHSPLRHDFFDLIKKMVGFYSLAFLYFMIRDPARLQSEGYNLEQQAMALSTEKDPGEFNISSQEKLTSNCSPECSHETNFEIEVKPPS